MDFGLIMTKNLCIISGGTATNELVSLFSSISSKITYVLPISDNGGSTSELIRVIGGPAIGDIRSRLTRLIPNNHENLRQLLSYRLSSDSTLAKVQWNEIVDGTHQIWKSIDSPTKKIIRSFLIHLHTELLKRSKFQFNSNPNSNSNRQFRFELANVGNLFLTGLRLFIGSLDSAIELFIKLTGIDSNISVLPCINTNFSYHISALLENDLIITGQSQISHPSDNLLDNYPLPIDNTRPPSPLHLEKIQSNQNEINHHHSNPDLSTNLNQIILNHQPNLNRLNLGDNEIDLLQQIDDIDMNPILNSSNLSDIPTSNRTSPIIPLNRVAISQLNHKQSNKSLLYSKEDSDDEETGNIPQYIHPELKKSQLHFNKTNIQPLLSPIKRIFYISPYGEEICPIAHSRVTTSISNSDAIIYSIGSLMTSIIPVIILRGIGRAIANDLDANNERKLKKKILLLNGCTDRETFGMSATDFIRVIFDLAIYSLKKSKYSENRINQLKWNNIITHLIYMKNSKIQVDIEYLASMGISCVEVDKVENEDYYELKSLEMNLRNILEN